MAESSRMVKQPRPQKFGRPWSYNEVLVRQRVVLKRPQEQPECWPEDWHPDPDRWPAWLPRGWFQVRRRGCPRSAWVSPTGVLFKRKEHVQKHLDAPLRDGRHVEGMVKAHFPFEKEPETDTCPCYWPFRLPQDWRIGLKFEDKRKISMCYYPPGEDTTFLATLHEVEKAVSLDGRYDMAFPAAPLTGSTGNQATDKHHNNRNTSTPPFNLDQLYAGTTLQVMSDEDKKMRLWTYEEVMTSREQRRANLPQNWPEGAQLDAGRWVPWLPQGWIQVRKVSKDGASRAAWVSPEGTLYARREQAQTQITREAQRNAGPEATAPSALPDEWPALLPHDWRMAVILGTDWGPPTMRFFPPGDDNHFVTSVEAVHQVANEDQDSRGKRGSSALKAEPKARPKRLHSRPNSSRPRVRRRLDKPDNEEEIERSRKELEAQLSRYMQLCRRQEQASTDMEGSQASGPATEGAAASSSHDDPTRATGALIAGIYDSERDLE